VNLLIVGANSKKNKVLQHLKQLAMFKEKIAILDFSLESNQYCNQFKNIEIFDGSRLLNDYVTKCGHKKIKELNQILLTHPTLLMSNFSELNFSHKVWINYLYKETIDIFISNKNFKKIYFINIASDIEIFFLNKLNNNFFQKKTIQIKNILYKIYQLLALDLIYLRNLITELSYITLKNNINNQSLIIYSDINKQWLKKNDYTYIRYIGENTCQDIENVLIAATSLRRNSLSLKNPFRAYQDRKVVCNNKNVVFIENFVSKIEILKIYFKQNNEIRNSIDLISELNTFLKQNYSRLLILKKLKIEIAKNTVIKKGLESIIKSNRNITQAIVPVFELVEGRIAVNTFNLNGIKTLGMQHGPIGKWSKWRFIFSMESLSSTHRAYTPWKYLVEGNYIKKQFNEISPDKIKIIGAPRILIKNRSDEPFKNNILILLDMHNWKFNFRFITSLKKISDEYNLIIRSHPSQYNYVRKFCKKNLKNLNFSLDNSSSINSSLDKYNPFFCIIGDSGVILEIALQQTPCVLIQTPGKPINSPLASNFQKILIINDKFTTNDVIKYLKININLKNYLKEQLLFTQEHIRYIADEAEVNLKSINKNEKNRV
tara:strand:- start:1631 stop:3433 length:1803 start_codon:yes stop_codon:yes gene_type:complete